MADRGDELWTVLAEMFGATALEAKYGVKIPRTWRSAISQLNDFEFARGCRRLLRFRRGVPSLPEFLNLCREVGAEDDPNTIPPAFRLTPPTDDAKGFDRWAIVANRKLLRHICTQAERKIFYTDRDPQRALELLQPLLEHKRQWAQEMREAEAARELPANGDDAAWTDRMARAEVWVNEIRVAHAARVAA